MLFDMTYEVIDSTGTPLEAFDTPEAALACRRKLAAESNSDEFAVLAISDTGVAVDRIDQTSPAMAG